MKKLTLLTILFVWASIAFAASIQPIYNGQLQTPLDANGHPINNVLTLQLLTNGAGAHLIDIDPLGSDTTEHYGIGFGSDAAIFRSGSGTITLKGNLIVTGSFPGNALTNTTVTPGSYGDATHSTALTVQADGRVTGASNTLITGVTPGGAAGGDLAGTFPNPTLAVIAAGGTYGDGTHVPQLTYDTKGRVTGVTSVTISGAPPIGSAAGDLAGSYPSPTLATFGASAGTWGDGTHVPQLTVDSKGRVSSVTAVTITAAAPIGSAGGSLAGSYPNPTLALIGGLAYGSYGDATHTPVFTVGTNGLVLSASTVQITGVAPAGAAGGDLAGTYPNPTLPYSGVTASTYGTGLLIPVITVNAKGLITSASTVAITSAAPSGSAGGDLTGSYPNPTLTTSGVSAATYGDAATVPQITVNAKGLVTSASAVAITGVAPGGLAGGDLNGTYPNPTLGDTAVTAGTYGDSNHIPQFVVNAQGRITSATSLAFTTGTFSLLSVTGTETAAYVTATLLNANTLTATSGTFGLLNTGTITAPGNALSMPLALTTGTISSTSGTFGALSVTGGATVGGNLSVTGTVTATSGSMGLVTTPTANVTTANVTSTLNLGGTNINTVIANTVMPTTYAAQGTTFNMSTSDPGWGTGWGTPTTPLAMLASEVAANTVFTLDPYTGYSYTTDRVIQVPESAGTVGKVYTFVRTRFSASGYQQQSAFIITGSSHPVYGMTVGPALTSVGDSVSLMLLGNADAGNSWVMVGSNHTPCTYSSSNPTVVSYNNPFADVITLTAAGTVPLPSLGAPPYDALDRHVVRYKSTAASSITFNTANTTDQIATPTTSGTTYTSGTNSVTFLVSGTGTRVWTVLGP